MTDIRHPKFKQIATAIAFSPRLEANIAEALKLTERMGARLTLIHVGEKDTTKKQTIKNILDTHAPGEQMVDIVWETGNPVDVILKASEERNIDLLIAGALQKESLSEFYVGSIARKLCRMAKCSLLMLTRPQTDGTSFDHIVVNGHEHSKTASAIHTSLYFAERTLARQLTIVDEMDNSDTSMKVEDDATLAKSLELRKEVSTHEKERIEKIVDAYPLEKELRIEHRYIFGKSGYSISHFAQSIRADLLVVNSPDKKLGFLDRFFTHDIEYILSDMPCNLLIVRVK